MSLKNHRFVQPHTSCQGVIFRTRRLIGGNLSGIDQVIFQQGIIHKNYSILLV